MSRTSAAALLAVVCLIRASTSAFGNDDSLAQKWQAERRAKSDTLTKTEELLDRLYQGRLEETRGRVRRLYKLTRSHFPRLWADENARADAARWLGTARRIIERDKRELSILRNEIQLTKQARRAIDAPLDVGDVLVPDDFRAPLEDVKVREKSGPYHLRGERRKVHLRRRGVWLEASEGDALRAPMAGKVVFHGHVSGVGAALMIASETHVAIVGGVSSTLSQGEFIEVGESLGSATGNVYLELRRRGGLVGMVIRPESLLP